LHRDESPPASERASEQKCATREPRAAAKCNRPILTTKAYHVCRPAGPGPTLPHPSSPLLSSRAMKFSSCRGPGLRDTRAHAKPYRSTVPRIFHACRGRRGASNKSPQKREKVVGPRLSRGPARRRHVAGMRPHDRRDRSFGSPAPEPPSRHRDWTTLPDARKDGTMQNLTEIVTIARSLSGVTAKSGMRSHYAPFCLLEFFRLRRWMLLLVRLFAFPPDK